MNYISIPIAGLHLFSEYMFWKSQGICYLFHLIYSLYFFSSTYCVLEGQASYFLALPSIPLGNRPLKTVFVKKRFSPLDCDMRCHSVPHVVRR